MSFITPEDFRRAEHSDATASLNDALAESSRTRVPVVCKKDAMYNVSIAGRKSFINGEGRLLASKNYCVQIPSGARIDWNGSVLSVSSGIDAVVLSNERTSTFGDIISCKNVRIDGGGKLDAARKLPMVWFWGLAAGSYLDHITLRNCSYMAGLLANCSDLDVGALEVEDIRGQGWVIGGNTFDKVKRSHFGRLAAKRIDTYETFNQPGNGFVIGGEDLDIKLVSQRNCAGGIKIAPNALRICLAAAHLDGTVLAGEADYNSQNCGIKIQGDDASTKPDFIDIGSIKARKQAGAGCYIRHSGTVSIGIYEGDHNATLGRDADFDSGSVLRLTVGRIVSKWSGFRGVDFGPGSGISHVGGVSVYNCAEVTDAEASGFRPLAGQFWVGVLRILDDRQPRKVIVALGATSANVVGVIERYRTNAGNYNDVRSKQIEVRDVRLDDLNSPTSGQVRLASGMKITVISSVDLNSQIMSSRNIQPVIRVKPANAAARALGNPYYYVTASHNITLIHPAAGGEEIYEYTVIGYRVVAN